MSRKVEYNKLIRDNIPDIIAKAGNEPYYHTATAEEYRQKLLEKLTEELNEFKEMFSQHEVADLLEIIYAIVDEYGFNKDEIEKLRLERKQKRGAFAKKLILEYVIENDGYSYKKE